jgi:hypothetical protein
MDWNYILGDAEFYGVEVVELLAYVLVVAGIIMVIESIVDRIRGRRPGQPAAPQPTPSRAPDHRPLHGH